MTSRASIARGVAAVLLCGAMAAAVGLSGCDGESGDSAIRNVGLSVAGFYEGDPVAGTSAADITSLDLIQAGDDLQAVSSDGTFTFEETLQPLNGGTLWTLAVLHQRGIACIRFVDP